MRLWGLGNNKNAGNVVHTLMEQPFVSICIVNYNGRRHLRDCLSSIYNIDYPKEKFEVLVADNASIDGSVEFISKDFPAITVLPLKKNYGFARANNICAEAAKGDYIVFLNNDTVVTKGWLGALVNKIASDQDIGVVGSKLLFHDRPNIINSAGGRIVFNGGGYDVGFMDTDSDKYNVGSYCGCVCGASLMVRKGEFRDIEMFDEDYFMYFEDVDLCWRYWLRGKKVWYAPESIVYHKFGGSSSGEKHHPLRVFYGTRNSLSNIVKNYETTHIILPFMIFSLYNFSKLISFMIKLDFNSIRALIKGYGIFFVSLPRLLKKRKGIQGRRVVSDSYLLKNNIIESPIGTFKELVRLIKLT